MSRNIPRRRNLFGLHLGGRRTTLHKRGGLTVRDLKQRAHDAGRATGDTARFDSWYEAYREWGRKRELRQAYRAGVESLWTESGGRATASGGAGRSRKSSTGGKRGHTSSSPTGVRLDVAHALENLGMSERDAAKAARNAKGNDFESMFRSAMRRNPATPASRIYRRHARVTTHPAFGNLSPATQAAILTLSRHAAALLTQRRSA